jgi:hypothetical protein
MSKISSPITFSSYYKIAPKVLDDLGVFDPTLNIDTKLFIDPLLLSKSSYDIINVKAVEKLEKYYENIISLLEESKIKDDFAYKHAERLIHVKELPGTCLGYGTTSTSGRSLSASIRKKIIDTADEIIKIGVKKPELFFVLPLFEEGIGADTISDITTSAIQSVLYDFTAQIAVKLDIKTISVEIHGETFDIIQNPLNKIISPIILLPQDILRSLPFATCWDDIEEAAYFNQNLRYKLNTYISQLWQAKTKKDKERHLALLMRNKTDIEILIESLKKTKITPYDFENDKDEVLLSRHLATFITGQPLNCNLLDNENKNIEKIVLDIIKEFKFLIENKGGNMLLWKDKSHNQIEKVSQKVFLIIADSYCKAFNIDINPEMDTGNGYVDFKFSKGYSDKVIVEIKHSTHSDIINGYNIQLETYKKSENAKKGYFIIIGFDKFCKKHNELREMYKNDLVKLSEIFYVDATLKPPASKRKNIKSQKIVFDDMDNIKFEMPKAEIDFDCFEIKITDSNVDFEENSKNEK